MANSTVNGSDIPSTSLPPLTPLPPITPYHYQWQPQPPPTSADSSTGFMFTTIATVVFVIILMCVCKYRQEDSNDGSVAGAGATTDSSITAGRWLFPSPPRDGVQLPRPCDRPRVHVLPPSLPPAFTYNRAVKHNVALKPGGGGEEAATCSVCLGVFQSGERVRLLPLCLHLYHAECIDPWLAAHSTCPVCRSGTNTADIGMLPPV